jgi:thiol-disulfide isomerase/thioredoxin
LYNYKKDKPLNLTTENKQDSWNWNDSWNAPNSPGTPETNPLPQVKPPVQQPPQQMIVASSYEDALKKSEELGRPVLLFFESQSCTWCQKMKSETLADTNVRNLMKNYIYCTIDAGTNRTVAAKYSIQYVPAFVITNSTGVSLKSGQKYMSVEAFATWVNNPSLFNQPKVQPNTPPVSPETNPVAPNPQPQEQPKNPKRVRPKNPNCPNCPQVL